MSDRRAEYKGLATASRAAGMGLLVGTILFGLGEPLPLQEWQVNVLLGGVAGSAFLYYVLAPLFEEEYPGESRSAYA
ncbi:MAG: hypothetical protein AAB955_00265 [Patescibacteria group bacterium]